MKKIFVLFLVLFLNINTVFATATIEFKNHTQKEVRDLISKYYIQQGIRVDNITDYSLAATKVYTGPLAVFASSFFYGAHTNSYPELKYNFNIIQNGSNVIVALSLVQLNNAGTAFQSPIYLSTKSEIEELNKLSKSIFAYYTYGFSCIPYKHALKAVDVIPNQAAYNKGLRDNCTIIEINGKSTVGMPIKAVGNEIMPKSQNSNITMKYIQNKNSMPVEITIDCQLVKPLENL